MFFKRPVNQWIARLLGLAAFLPAVFVLTHPLPVNWLRPLCRDTWPLPAICAFTTVSAFCLRRYGAYASLALIALTQAIFQAWCYNTGSHPALNPTLLWGILPQTDSHLYYSQACEILNGQQISVCLGARHPYPMFLAALLWFCGHDFRLVTTLSVLLLSFATWLSFEVIRYRLGHVVAAVELIFLTFYIRIFCTGLFMTEQLGFLFALCSVTLLIESLAREGRLRLWLWCGSLFTLTQALNARPAAYLTLPLLALAGWPLFPGSARRRATVIGLGCLSVAFSLFLHYATFTRIVSPPMMASNAWDCIYGLLNDGTWVDGLRRSREFTPNKVAFSFTDNDQTRREGAQASYRLREVCLKEIEEHPAKVLVGWKRALSFAWEKNVAFRSDYPLMPAIWFTEIGRYLTVLGLLLAAALLLARRLTPGLQRYSRLSWLLLSAFGGMILSFPCAPPWDGEMRILAATLPLFYLLPGLAVGALAYLPGYVARRSKIGFFSEGRPEASHNFPVVSATTLSLALTILELSVPWFVQPSDSGAKVHPVVAMMRKVVDGNPPSYFDLASLRCGYSIHLSDHRQTWLPEISKKDFLQNLPRGSYLPLASRFKKLPFGSEVMTLPYWVLLVLPAEEAAKDRFTPSPDQVGKRIWPAVYFDRDLMGLPSARQPSSTKPK